MNRTLLDDDKLEIIELTLYKYQSFLDFLRNAGFGKLIEMGDLSQEQHHNPVKQKNSQKNKSSSSKSKRQTLSPSNSKLTDQQRYYLEKINRTKSKMNKNSLESTKNYSMSESRNDGKYPQSIEGFINYDMIDKSLITGQVKLYTQKYFFILKLIKLNGFFFKRMEQKIIISTHY